MERIGHVSGLRVRDGNSAMADRLGMDSTSDMTFQTPDEIEFLSVSPAQHAVNARRRALFADGVSGEAEWPLSESPPGETLELGKFEPSYSRYDIVFHLQCCVGVNQPVSTDVIECENFDELCVAVANVPEGELMALLVSNTYDCSGYYCSGGICHDTTAQEFVDSFDLLGVFDDRDALLSRASREIKKAAANVATFELNHGHRPTVSGLKSVRTVY